jgi:hypothetical protein
MTTPTPDVGHARPRPELDRGNSPRKQRSVTRRFTRGWLLAVLPATAAVALTGALGAAGAQAEPHPDRRPTDVSLAGVSTAFAAERAACTTEKAGKGCFYPHGDHILVQDLKSDGARVSVQWVTSYGRRGHLPPRPLQLQHARKRADSIPARGARRQPRDPLPVGRPGPHHLTRMKSDTRERTLRAGGCMAIGGAAAMLTGSTPIGIAIVAGVAGALAWRTAAGRPRARG